ncbi:syntaxin-19 isoform X2 [Hypomesus transpacificus]|uniref:syntaxin-19 isoform X2 n=1 Tax=Hypomesus transpacificus TaxID=137520 RepID=UPI001F084DAA|nr:syntaxin-19 isoform X2 [Hypomesus transpacificus]
MRDRLAELRQRAQEFRETGSEMDPSPFPVEDETEDPAGLGVMAPQAVMFEEEPVLENFLSEAQHIRDNLAELETEVLKFSQQQKSLVATMRRFSVMKKESGVTRDIKLQAESLHRRLEILSKQAERTEAQHGPPAAVTRIQQSQYAALHRRFQQLEVSGRVVTEEEVDEMVATGKWDVFNENLLNDAKITRTQLSEIEQRHKELLNLESNMKELKELFMDVFLLVEEQGAYIDHIQTNVEKTQDYVMVTNEKFKLAARYKKKNPLRQLCCCCCPPWKSCL